MRFWLCCVPHPLPPRVKPRTTGTRGEGSLTLFCPGGLLKCPPTHTQAPAWPRESWWGPQNVPVKPGPGRAVTVPSGMSLGSGEPAGKPGGSREGEQSHPVCPTWGSRREAQTSHAPRAGREGMWHGPPASQSCHLHTQWASLQGPPARDTQDHTETLRPGGFDTDLPSFSFVLK